jgi:hypothetical protein
VNTHDVKLSDITVRLAANPSGMTLFPHEIQWLVAEVVRLREAETELRRVHAERMAECRGNAVRLREERDPERERDPLAAPDDPWGIEPDEGWPLPDREDATDA